MGKEKVTFVRPYFRESDHTYTLDDKPIPGFSEIMQDLGFMDFGRIPKEVLAHAAQRGKAVHLGCQFYDRGTLEWENVDPEIKGYLQAYMRFRKAWPEKIIIAEQPMANREWGYACTPDLIAQKFEGDILVVDIKTGAPMPWHPLQTMAQSLCIIHGGLIIKRCSVYLKDDGTWKPGHHKDDKNDRLDWQSIVRTYHRKHRR